MGWVSHLEYYWREPSFARFLRRLAGFSRLILFDKRGTGLVRSGHRDADARAAHGRRARGARRGGIASAQPCLACPKADRCARCSRPRIPEQNRGARDGRHLRPPRVRTGLSVGADAGSSARRSASEIVEHWGGPVGIEERAPSVASDPAFRDWWATYLRMGASPAAAVALTRMNAADRHPSHPADRARPVTGDAPNGRSPPASSRKAGTSRA